MKKVRIGTDYKIHVSLSNPSIETIQVLSITAIVVNTTAENRFRELINRKFRFHSYTLHGRLFSHYHPNKYDTNMSGDVRYFSDPHDHCYTGFGVNPTWDYIYGNRFNPCCTVILDVRYIASNDEALINFRADLQNLCGVYKLILIIKAFVSNDEEAAIKTITVDYPNLFELVDYNPESDEDFDVDVDDVSDKYVKYGEYSDSTNHVDLSLTDGSSVTFDMSSGLGWEER